MDNSGSRFAIGLLILWGAFILLFVALHHNGIPNANNPNDALQWLVGEFQDVTGLSGTTPANAGTGAAGSASNPVPTPTGTEPFDTGVTQ
jgi:hypothetical protein